MTQQRYKELASQRGANAAGRLARLQVRVAKDRQEIEAAAPKDQLVNLPELQIAGRIDNDEEKICVRGMDVMKSRM